MIDENLFIGPEKRIYMKTEEYGIIDATTYVLSLVKGWFIQNNYHISKSTNPENRLQALMYSDDEEIVQKVQNFYSIKDKDFTDTLRKEELPYVEHLRPKE